MPGSRCDEVGAVARSQYHCAHDVERVGLRGGYSCEVAIHDLADAVTVWLGEGGGHADDVARWVENSPVVHLDGVWGAVYEICHGNMHLVCVVRNFYVKI